MKTVKEITLPEAMRGVADALAEPATSVTELERLELRAAYFELQAYRAVCEELQARSLRALDQRAAAETRYKLVRAAIDALYGLAPSDLVNIDTGAIARREREP